MMIVYLITNLTNGKRYVGQTVRSLSRRWKIHVAEARRGSPWILHKAIRKYGPENFSVQELSIAVTVDHLNQLEQYYIREFKSGNSRYGYNMNAGGNGHPNHAVSEESRKKMSASHKGQRSWNKGKKMSAEHRMKLRIAHTGKKLSEAHRRAQSLGKLGNTNCVGHRQTAQQREACRQRMLGNQFARLA